MSEIKGGKTLQGIVVGAKKMRKTVTVAVEHTSQHDKYKKTVKKTTKMKVHDEHEISAVGDKVLIADCGRRISKDKAWVLREIVKPATASSSID